jgi:hypothetical protein
VLQPGFTGNGLPHARGGGFQTTSGQKECCNIEQFGADRLEIWLSNHLWSEGVLQRGIWLRLVRLVPLSNHLWSEGVLQPPAI